MYSQITTEQINIDIRDTQREVDDLSNAIKARLEFIEKLKSILVERESN